MPRIKGDRYKHERWLVAQMAETVAAEMEREAFEALVKDLMRLRYGITLDEAQAEAYERTHGKFYSRAKVVCYAVLEQFKATVITQLSRGAEVDIGEVKWFVTTRAARRFRIPLRGVGMVSGESPARSVPAARFSKGFRKRVREEAPRPAMPVPAAEGAPGAG